MTRIFIENYEVELTSDLSNELTFSIDDIKKIDSKTSSFSKTIVLIGTQANNKLLGNIFELSQANFTNTSSNVLYNFNPSKSATARIEINGMQVMKGVMRLLSINIDRGQIEYEVALFGELSGFVSNLGVRKLEDLDFSNYNTNWDVGNIIGSWDPRIIYSCQCDIYGLYQSIDPPYYFWYAYRMYGVNATTSIEVGDLISVTGSTYNNGVFIVRDIIYFPTQNRTDIKIEVPAFSSFTQEANVTINIVALKDYGQGVVFPLIDYGVAQAPSFPRNHDFRHFRPALFVREYMKKIIEDAGYTYESIFFDTPFFKRLIIPNNDIGLEKRGQNYYVRIEDDALNIGQYQNNTINTMTTLLTWNWSTPPISLVNFTYNTGDNKFYYNGVSTINTKLKLNIDVKFQASPNVIVHFQIRRQKSGQTTGDVIAELQMQKDPRTYGGQRKKGTIEIQSEIQVNDKVYVTIEINFPAPVWQNGNVFTPTLNYIQSDSQISSFIVEQDPAGFIQYTYGELLDINKMIPRNIYQKDFFIAVMKMFNLMVVEDKYRERHLVIEPYIDFYNDSFSSYLDWSYNVDRSQVMKIVPMSEANSRLYEFKFKDDSDYFNEKYKKKFNETYGNRVYDNQLEFSKDKSSVELIFSPSVLYGEPNEEKVFPAIYKYDENTQRKTPMAHNIRIMQIKLIDGLQQGWNIYNGSTSLNPYLQKYLYCGHLNNPYEPSNDINWGATQELYFTPSSTGSLQFNLFYNFYSPYLAEIVNKDSRLLECTMYLTEKEINNLDFSRYVMIDGVLFRLIKIQDWKESNLCKVILLRVINTRYFVETPVSAKTLLMRFFDMGEVNTLIGGDKYDVGVWNNFFNIPQGKQFVSVFIENNYVYLYGALEFSIRPDKFSNNSNIIDFVDNIGCIVEVGNSAFRNCSRLETIYLKNVRKINEATFTACEVLYKVSFPQVIKIGNSCFDGCINMKYLDLSNLGNEYYNGQQVAGFCGDDLGNNDVFRSIHNNNIELKIHHSAYQSNDSDIVDFIQQNNINLIIT